MWQSWVDIEHYSVTYFDCVTMFDEVALHRTSTEDGAHMCQVLMSLCNMYEPYP